MAQFQVSFGTYTDFFLEDLSTKVPVAQWIERRFPKASVVGSIPAGDTLSFKGLINRVSSEMKKLYIFLLFTFTLFSFDKEFEGIIKKTGEGAYKINVEPFEDEEPAKFNTIKVKDGRVFLSGPKDKIDFPVPANLKKDTHLGFFYTYVKEDNYEHSEVIYRKPKNFDYRLIALYHETQEYERDMVSDKLPYVFLEGVAIVEDDGYFYVIKKIEKDRIVYIDSDGDEIIDEKFKNQKMLKIPIGYKSVY